MQGIVSYITESKLSDQVFCQQFSKMFTDTGITVDCLTKVINNLDKEFVKKLSDYFAETDMANFVSYQPSDDMFLQYDINKDQIVSQLVKYILK